MGVKGLWELLHPVARPIKLENLSDKYLAVDASIWLHQFLRGMRDKEGQVITNAHIIGFFRRICKLLYYNVKPIFVFDGGTPALKRLTIQERRKRKRHDANMVKKTAEKLLAAQLRLHALEQRKAARKRKAEEKQRKIDGVIHDSDDNPKYLDAIESDQSAAQIDMKKELGSIIGSQAKRIKDKYVLPPMEIDFDELSRLRSNDERFGYQEQDELVDFLSSFKKEGSLNNIDSDVFKSLPSEVQYEILQDIRLRSRVTSYERVQEMVRLSDTPMDFSQLQVQGVIRRNNVTQKLLTVNKAVSKVETEVAKPGRIASQRNRQYILIKNDDGGWVLGGKKPTTGQTADKPVQLDSDEEVADVKEEVKNEEDDSDWESDDDVELEEVKIPHTINPVATMKEPKSQLVQLSAGSVSKVDDSNLLINHLEAYVDEDESIEKVMAKFAEIEDEASRKMGARDLLAHSDSHLEETDTTNEKNGLHLIRESDVIQIQDGARMHLTKASMRLKNDPQWPEVISDDEELGSLDTLFSMDTIPSDNTVDYDNFDDMVEDENTGEIISRSAYNKRYQYPYIPEKPKMRALTALEESKLKRGAFQRYWAGYTPDCFKLKNPEHNIMIDDAINNWDDEKLAAEIRSATRKHEKSNVNDTLGVETLLFWKSFLESLALRRQHLQTSRSSMPVIELDEPKLENKPDVINLDRKSRPILLDDSDEDDVVITEGIELSHHQKYIPAPAQTHESVLIHSPTPEHIDPETVPINTTPAGQYPALDFSSSILKKQLPNDNKGIDVPSSMSSNINGSYDQLGLSDESTIPDVMHQDVDLGLTVGVSARDAGANSAASSPRPCSETAVVPTFDKSIDHSEDSDAGEDEQPTVPMETDIDILPEEDMNDLEKIQEEDRAIEDDEEVEREVEEDEEEDDDEEDGHKVDFHNEEQDFSNRFPNIANLPGAILNSKNSEENEEGLVAQEEKLILSAEEKEILEKQEAKKLFEESRQLESEIKTLKDQHRKHQRDADDLTESMVSETQALLRLFGIPYLVAPMEAEAQCADLQLRGVVDGILTEDSDVFLFGGARVFKNMFKEEKYVECYLMSDIERDLGVGRDRLVALAYLLGSDYTTGIKGVGLITAMEIIRLFPKLENFARWWKGEHQNIGDDDGDKSKNNGVGLTETELDSIDEVALEKLAKQCKKIHIPSTFPDPHVAEAYTSPLVDDDPAKFQWGIPDLDGLRDFLRKNLGWDRREVDQALLPIIRQMSSAKSQTQSTLDGFFDISAGMGSFQPLNNANMFKSARLRKVVDGLKGLSSSNPNESDDTESTDKTTKKSKVTPKKAGTKRKPATKKGKQQDSSKGAEADIEESLDAIEILDDDLEDEEEGSQGNHEQKKRKVSQSASQKKNITAQTKVPEAVIAAKNHLKSKDIQVRLAERRRNNAANANGIEAQVQPTRVHKRSKSDSTDSSGDSDDSKDDDFTSSHWDLLNEKQSQVEQQASRSGSQAPLSTSSGRESALTAMVSATNAARYGTGSFRDKITKSPNKSKKARVQK